MADKVSYKDFSARIKSKYPQYNSIDDLELSKKIIEKYPEYKESVLFDTIPETKEKPVVQPEVVTQPEIPAQQPAEEAAQLPPAEERQQTLPNYDQKLYDKFNEKMAAEFGLIDNASTIRQDVFEAKKDELQPFVKDGLVDINTYQAQKAFQGELDRQTKIIENAQKLELTPEFLTHVVDLNKMITPVSDDAQKQEDYLFGSLQQFNQGVAELVRTVDRGLKMSAESAGFEWKNPLFRDIADAVDRVGAEGAYKVPDNIAGQIAGAVSYIAPDLIATFVMPELKLAQMGRITGGLVTKIPKFPTLLAAKEGFRMYEQSTDDKYNSFLKGAAHGFQEGLTYEALGLIGKEAAQLVNAMGAGKLVTESVGGLASGTLFGTHALIADPEVWNNGDIDWEKGKDAFWTNFGVGIAFHGKKIGEEIVNTATINQSATRKAHAAFWTSNRDLIRTGLSSDKTQFQLRRESQKYWQMAMEAKTPTEKNQYMIAKTSIDNIIASRAMAENIAQNPKAYIEAVKNQPDLTDKEKEFFTKRINETVEDYTNISKEIEAKDKAAKEEALNDQSKLDYLKSKGVDVPNGTSMVELERIYQAEKKKSTESENIQKDSEKKLTEKKSDLPVNEPTKDLVETKSSPKSETVEKGGSQKLEEFQNLLNEGINKPDKESEVVNAEKTTQKTVEPVPEKGAEGKGVGTGSVRDAKQDRGAKKAITSKTTKDEKRDDGKLGNERDGRTATEKVQEQQKLDEQNVEPKKQTEETKPGSESSKEQVSEKKVEREKRIAEIDSELGDAWSDLADIVGAKKSITGEERKRLAPVVKRVTRLYAEKYLLKGQELIESVKEYFSKKGVEIDDDLIKGSTGYSEIKNKKISATGDFLSDVRDAVTEKNISGISKKIVKQKQKQFDAEMNNVVKPIIKRIDKEGLTVNYTDTGGVERNYTVKKKEDGSLSVTYKTYDTKKKKNVSHTVTEAKHLQEIKKKYLEQREADIKEITDKVENKFLEETDAEIKKAIDEYTAKRDAELPKAPAEFSDKTPAPGTTEFKKMKPQREKKPSAGTKIVVDEMSVIRDEIKLWTKQAREQKKWTEGEYAELTGKIREKIKAAADAGTYHSRTIQGNHQ
jgi:hypothetical protein